MAYPTYPKQKYGAELHMLQMDFRRLEEKVALKPPDFSDLVAVQGLLKRSHCLTTEPGFRECQAGLYLLRHRVQLLTDASYHPSNAFSRPMPSLNLQDDLREEFLIRAIKVMSERFNKDRNQTTGVVSLGSPDQPRITGQLQGCWKLLGAIPDLSNARYVKLYSDLRCWERVIPVTVPVSDNESQKLSPV